jgi:chaperonin GroEL
MLRRWVTPITAKMRKRGTCVDIIKAGIIDPTKIVRLALQGTASVADLLVTTEAMIVDKAEKGKPAQPAGGSMDAMDY